MMTNELYDDRAIALDLHGVLSEIDPARWRDEMAAALKARLAEIQRRLEVRSSRSRLGAVANALRTELPALDLAPAPDVRARWLAFKQRVQPAYASMAASLRAESIHVPSLRPTNYARNVFHVGSALVALVAIEALHSPGILLGIAVAWAGFAWSCELAKRLSPWVNAKLMRFFAPVAHPHETHRVNSATWYATALVLLAATQSITLCAIAVAVLGVGDPLAALIGRRFGRVRLLHGRSLEGSLAFLLSAGLIGFTLLRAFHAGGIGLGAAAVVSLCAAAAGALAELVSLRVDDNFSIPLSAAAGGALAMWALSLPIQ